MIRDTLTWLAAATFGLAGGLAGQAVALEMPFAAEALAERITEYGSYALPVTPWTAQAGVGTRRIDGRIVRHTWRLGGGGRTTLQVLDPLKAQIEAEGFVPVFDCEARSCGGFDFRFAIEVVPAPDMHVDISDFRFLAATRAEDRGGGAVSLLVSSARDASYVQEIRVSPVAQKPAPVRSDSREPKTDMPFAASLEQAGHVVLVGVGFESGSDRLLDTDVPIFAELAAYLETHPDMRVALVGHTDADGGLEANIDLSRRRAEAVQAELERGHGVPPSRLEARGIGYLAPIASNRTEEGRQINRRVEAVLLPPR
jgi:OOP family OmpA-OmpF porin